MRVGVALLVAGLMTSPVGATPALRVVSLSLCADQFLLALDAQSQIAGLSRLATDPHRRPGGGRADP